MMMIKATIAVILFVSVVLSSVDIAFSQRSPGSETGSVPKVKKTCVSVVRNFVPRLANMLSLTGSTHAHKNNRRWQLLLESWELDCDNIAKARLMNQMAVRIRNNHDHKVAVIIPTYHYEKKLSQALIQGVQAACTQNEWCDNSKHILIRTLTHPSQRALERIMAHLITVEKVSLVIAGFDANNHEYYNKISSLFSLPVF